MAEPNPSLIETMLAVLGGAGTTIAGALVGRLMWHVNEVKSKRRSFFGKEMLWEIPIVAGMAIIGDATADWLGLSDNATIGFVAMLAYLGPRWFEATVNRYFSQRNNPME